MRRTALALAILIATCMPALSAPQDGDSRDGDSRRRLLGFSGDAGIKKTISRKTITVAVIGLLDPQASDLGSGISSQILREAVAMSDEWANEGENPRVEWKLAADDRFIALVREHYHEGAVTVARQNDAEIAFWGVIQRLGNRTFIRSFLSVDPEIADASLGLRIKRYGRTKFGVGIPYSSFDLGVAELDQRKEVGSTSHIFRTALASGKARGSFVPALFGGEHSVERVNYSSGRRPRLFPGLDFVSGVAAFLLSNYQPAIAHLHTFLNQGHQSDDVARAAAHQMTGVSQIAIGRQPEAVGSFEEAVRRLPYSVETRKLSAIANILVSDLDRATLALIKASDLDSMDQQTKNMWKYVARLREETTRRDDPRPPLQQPAVPF